jgi:hypothetical protein
LATKRIETGRVKTVVPGKNVSAKIRIGGQNIASAINLKKTLPQNICQAVFFINISYNSSLKKNCVTSWGLVLKYMLHII